MYYMIWNKIKAFFSDETEEESKPIEVRADIVDYKPARDVVDAIRSQIEFNVEELEFDNDDIHNYTFSNLSDEAKKKILDIIHEDLRGQALLKEEQFNKMNIKEENE